MSSLRSIRRKLRTARAFTARDWGTLARAWALLLGVDLALRVLPFTQIRDRMARTAHVAHPRVGHQYEALIQATQRTVDIAARHHLYPMRCLRRALVLQRLLADRGVAADLRFGVERSAGDFRAHAWLEYNGKPVGEPGTVTQRFAPLTAVEVRR